MEYKTPVPPQASYGEPASNQQAQFAIEPCAAILRHDGNVRSGMFHLLKCGHIVAIDGGDTRCGINCQETANSAQSSTLYARDRTYIVKSIAHPSSQSDDPRPPVFARGAAP
ncbi:hypothetical protein AA0117_g4486 [Alternaria alternata]|uniref:Uncharacterized protein n=1 Tax=Alternaria alternata TaxID=5599 RepID=A0A4Q4NJX1_ALTAL|nr:hypothetical protein AA0118_g2011 [Alternaria tenuissima]RYN78469.1 hypothetical protein AA0117_g4486 [Alternaria alternata]RYO65897.1 hypothetical protein AA0116_g1947 [Alternaria tenuissima]